MTRRNVKITVPALTRVEGEGALDLEIRDGKIQSLQLRIYEPPRFFEKFLEGRSFHDVPDTVARICGICPVAYQMSAVQALENILQLTPSQWVQDMRRLMYCGEWIQSHSLHIHLLALPDFLGFNDVIQMAGQYANEVRRGLSLQAIGNDLIALFGGRSVHPVGVRTGGFSHTPRAEEAEALLKRVEAAIPQAEELVAWLASLDVPQQEQDFIAVALRHEHEYPMYSGRLVSSQGLDIDIQDFDDYFQEHQEAHSTALHCLLQGKPYLVGPLARLNLNLDRLPPAVQSVLQKTGVRFPSRNMFHSALARGVETLLCLQEAKRLLHDYEESSTPFWQESVRAGTGCGCTEAPRGILWHQYRIDEDGLIQSARIIPPTSQNQARIEADLHEAMVAAGLDREEQTLRLHAEKVIRNYDPCISCATHFLRLHLKRDSGVSKTAKRFAPLPVCADVLVIGIGSPRGNDRFGWDVADAVQQAAERSTINGLRAIKLDRPGADLLRFIEDADCVILVDAIHGMELKPDVCTWDSAQLPNERERGVSSHGFGLLQSLHLHHALHSSRRSVYVVGLPLSDHGHVQEYGEQEIADAVERIMRLAGGDDA